MVTIKAKPFLSAHNAITIEGQWMVQFLDDMDLNKNKKSNLGIVEIGNYFHPEHAISNTQVYSTRM